MRIFNIVMVVLILAYFYINRDQKPVDKDTLSDIEAVLLEDEIILVDRDDSVLLHPGTSTMIIEWPQ